MDTKPLNSQRDVGQHPPGAPDADSEQSVLYRAAYTIRWEQLSAVAAFAIKFPRDLLRQE